MLFIREQTPAIALKSTCPRYTLLNCARARLLFDRRAGELYNIRPMNWVDYLKK